ncbi:MAG TPA: hypothetical protein VII00_01800 [bacterium]
MKALDFSRIKRYSLKNRPSKVKTGDFCGNFSAGGSFAGFFESIPKILAGKDIRELVERIVSARRNNKPVLIGMGAHSIKVGLSPLFVQLMDMGIVTGFALNGACLVHDFEIAFAGKTSEDVDDALSTGSFGMADETGRIINTAIKKGVKKGYGIGRSVGEAIFKSRMKYGELSLLGNACRLKIPVSVHVALGTDIIHFHPEADGSAIGKGSLRDFHLLTSMVADLSGGVFLNVGSAVIIPEVFLKAVTIARNLGCKVNNIFTANLDFIQHYRPITNVVRRPVAGAGKGVALTGHHEIMLPLIFRAVMEGVG